MKQVLNSIKRFLPLLAVLGISVTALSIFIFLAKRLDVARHDFYKTRKELEMYRAGVWHLEKLNLEQLNRQLARTETRFPSSENLAVLIEELTDLAKKYEISIPSITPSEKVEVHEEQNGVLSVLNRIPLEMRLEGTYENLGNFLSQLSMLEHGIIKVDHLRFEKKGMDPTQVGLSLAASVYVKRTTEQAVLKEQISETAPVQRHAARSRFETTDQNPFTKKVEAPKVKETQMNIEGIIYDPAQPMVLISGETKGIGDRVNGMKIVEIRPDSIVFEKNGEQIKKYLHRD